MPSDLSINFPAFPTLLSKAKQLNEASDVVNAVLKDLEDRLAEANIGLTFWFDSKPLSQSDCVGDFSPSSTREETFEVLGYARIEGKWCLAVKRVRHVHGFFEGQMDCPYTNVLVDDDPAALLKTARETRLAAVRVLPEFVEKFTEMVTQTVGELEAATGDLFYEK